MGSDRPVFDASGQQAADQRIEATGGDRVTIGADALSVVREAFAIIRETFLDDTRRDHRVAVVDAWHRRIMAAMVVLIAATIAQTLLLVGVLLFIVSLLWPRLAAWL